jgi:hypothetical protein
MKFRSLIALSLGLLGIALAGCSPAHLYSADAGFARTSVITVHMDGTNVNATKAMAWWNTVAGRQLFVATTDGTAQVTIEPDTGTCGPVTTERVACTTALPSSGVFSSPPAYQYTSCQVDVSEIGATYWEVYAHELGHCLGFDHVTDRLSIMNVHPDSTNSAADRAMFTAAGYR